MIKLYVNYTELEIGQDTQNILATFSINDVAGVAERRGSITQEMFLPATPVNSQTLASCPASGYVASIESNGIVCFTGKLRVSKTEYLRGDVVGYSCTMYGDNLDFAYLLNQKQLRDVVTENFEHSLTNIRNGVTGKVKFPIVNYGDWFVDGKINLLEFRPAINAKYLLNQVFNEIGYTVESTWQSGDFADVHLLFTAGAYLPAADYCQQNSCRASLSGNQNGNYDVFDYALIQYDDDSTPPNYDPSGAFVVGTYEFRPPVTGTYRITVIIKTSDVLRPSLVDIIDTTNTYIESLYPIADDTYNITLTNTIYLNAYDGVTYFGLQFFAAAVGGATLAYQFDTGTSVEVRREGLDEDCEINISDCLPKDTTQLAFLKGLVHCFNLYIYADVALRKIYIEPRNRYYSETGGTLVDGFYPNEAILSINDIINIGEGCSVSIYDNLGESLIMGYGDGDSYVSQIEDGTNQKLYSAGWNMQTQTTVKPKNYENPVFGRFSLLSDFKLPVNQPNFAIIIPRLWGEAWDGGADYPVKSYDHPAMLAVIKSGVECYEYKINYIGGDTNYTDYVYAYMFDYPALSGSDFSLSFANETDIQENEKVGLFQRFYLREQVCKRGGEVLKLRAVVSAWLINYLNNIRYRTFFEYSGNIYSIQEIRNFVIGEDSICEITLLLERFASESDVNDIESNTLNCLNNVS